MGGQNVEAKMLNPYIKHDTFLVEYDARIKIIMRREMKQRVSMEASEN
jgi:hypothetical protein